MQKTRFKVIPEVHLFLIKDQEVLLLRRFNTGYEDGNYSVPAGHVDGNETLRLAMVREAKEEVCITINPDDLEVVHIIHKLITEERLAFFFTTKKWKEVPKNAEPHKCDDLSWFPIDKLPPNMVPYIRSALQNYLNGVIYSEFGW